MEWVQIIAIIGANLGLFIWARTEANQDRRQFYDLIKEIQSEMKDFHGRLVSLEERSKKGVFKS